MILAAIPVLSNSRTTGYAPCSVTGSAAFHAPPRSRFLHAQVLAVAMGRAAQRTNADRGPFVYYPMRPGLDNARQKVLSEFTQ